MLNTFHIPKTIVLVGMMGVGKTSIGRRLSQALNLEFKDSDHEIEIAAGHSVKDIFELYGESAFDDVERRVVSRLLDEPPHVLSTGVGAFIVAENRNIILKKGISVWLDASVETLLPRVTRRDHRPQLDKDEDKKALLESYMHTYYPHYEKADFRINCDNQMPDVTVEAIIQQLKTIF